MRDVHVVQEVLGEGFEMVGGFDEPLQHRMRVHLADAGDGTDAQTLSQCAYGPHQKLRRDPLAMQRCAVSFEAVALAGSAMQLPPAPTAGMPIGTAIAQAHPAPLGTGRLRAAMACGIHLAPAPPCDDQTGWRGGGSLQTGRGDLLTRLAVGLGEESRKGLRGSRTCARWSGGLGRPVRRFSGITRPSKMEHDAEPEESQAHQLVENKMGYHGKTPSYRC